MWPFHREYVYTRARVRLNKFQTNIEQIMRKNKRSVAHMFWWCFDGPQAVTKIVECVTNIVAKAKKLESSRKCHKILTLSSCLATRGEHYK